jgi:hypothetical protein
MQRVARSGQAACKTRVVVVLGFESALRKEGHALSAGLLCQMIGCSHIATFAIGFTASFRKASLDRWIATKAFCSVVIPPFVILIRLRRNEITRRDSRTFELAKAY